MTDTEFWNIIAQSRDGIESQEEQAERLIDILAELPPEEIQAFDQIFQGLRDESYRWSLWGAAYVIHGGCSDDGFDYFRAWLIGQGKEVYTKALENPDALADVLNDDNFAEDEELLYAASNAYEQSTGDDLPPSGTSHPDEPTGEAWEEDEVEAMFPRLAKMFS